MNLDVLNGYVLWVIGLFAVCLYIAMIAGGFGALVSRPPKARKRRSRSRSAKRGWRNAKRSTDS